MGNPLSLPRWVTGVSNWPSRLRAPLVNGVSADREGPGSESRFPLTTFVGDLGVVVDFLNGFKESRVFFKEAEAPGLTGLSALSVAFARRSLYSLLGILGKRGLVYVYVRFDI